MEKQPEIIVIDDEASIVKLVLSILKKGGFSADFSTDSLKGLDLIKKKNYQIVILDLCMPKESGLVILSKIKKINPLIQVIIITGYSSEFSLKACLKAGADEFICKPFEIDDILGAVNRSIKKIENFEKIETLEKINASEAAKKK